MTLSRALADEDYTAQRKGKAKLDRVQLPKAL